MPVTTRPTTLHDLAAVKAWLDVKHTSKDDVIASIADGVTALIEAKTHQAFITRTVSENYHGSGTRTLCLNNYPIVSVASLTVKRTEAGAPVTILSTEYDLDPVEGVIQLRSAIAAFDALFLNVAITYDYGYGARGALSADVAQVEPIALDMCKLIWSKYTSDSLVASSINVNAGQLVISEQWPRHISAGLRSLMRPRTP